MRRSSRNWRSPTGSRSWTSDAATEPPRCRRRGSAPNVLGVDIATNLVEAGNARAQSLGLSNCTVPGRRRDGPARTRGRPLRPRRQHLRSDVRAQAVRRRQGGRPGDAARRPDRHGELDPQRPDAGRPDPADQCRLLAAASRRLHQPDDLGGRAQRDRAIRRRGRTRSEDLVRAKHLHVQLPRHTHRSFSPSSGRTTAPP